MSEAGLAAAVAKMRDAGVSDAAVNVFRRYYGQLERGATGLIDEASIEPVGDLTHLHDLPADGAEVGDAFARTVVIKLNGGLGTSMGMDRAKSLLPVKDGLTFLDIMVRQVQTLREQHGVTLPLLFMNSFRTRDDTLAALARHEGIATDGLPLDFMQSQEPKLRADDLFPVEWPADPSLEWCPPGHADVYPSLLHTGLLDELIGRGYRWAFISNSDNLGAVPEPAIAGWMAAERIPFLLESCRRTPADRKGGHLAIRRADGRLVLRETAQTSSDDMAALQDLDRHRYCNTNNLWVDLTVLQRELDATGGVLDLPLIRNVKTVDPGDSSTPQVIQIESAMGAAVGAFDGARSLLVDRDRFVPVKTTNHLLVLRSDVYDLADGAFLRKSVPGRDDPFVDLDPDHFKLVGPFDSRFPEGPPSLVDA
ncbi:MAG: UTP--glucose-1-phosphate uridylyltransferase, partial [Jatrophihabitans sp.]|uniref:UTP--glucose-1-phosphate uridylyltransferase n=1 Tax=Jatrophihabitans sp. TaxID=1932789 RepID=UPI003F7E5064